MIQPQECFFHDIQGERNSVAYLKRIFFNHWVIKIIRECNERDETVSVQSCEPDVEPMSKRFRDWILYQHSGLCSNFIPFSALVFEFYPCILIQEQILYQSLGLYLNLNPVGFCSNFMPQFVLAFEFYSNLPVWTRVLYHPSGLCSNFVSFSALRFEFYPRLLVRDQIL